MKQVEGCNHELDVIEYRKLVYICKDCGYQKVDNYSRILKITELKRQEQAIDRVLARYYNGGGSNPSKGLV